MNKIKLILIILLFFIVSPVYAEELNIKSNNAVLYNLNDNIVIYEKNKDQKVSIASLTKLMTALVSVEKINDLNSRTNNFPYLGTLLLYLFHNHTFHQFLSH